MTTREGEAGPAERTDTKSETAPGTELSARAGAGGDAAETAPLTGTVAAPPDDAGQLAREIERTREQLGETVQELIAKVDVKSRALASANEVSGQLRDRAAAVGTSAWGAMPEQVRRTVTKGASGARERWLPLAVAAGVVIVGCLAVWQWKARPSSAARQGSVTTRSLNSGSRTSAERSSASRSRFSGQLCGPSRR